MTAPLTLSSLATLSTALARSARKPGVITFIDRSFTSIVRTAIPSAPVLNSIVSISLTIAVLARPACIVHKRAQRLTAESRLGEGSRAMGIGGMVGGVAFGGNKADRREPFRQRQPRRPCRNAYRQAHWLMNNPI